MLGLYCAASGDGTISEDEKQDEKHWKQGKQGGLAVNGWVALASYVVGCVLGWVAAVDACLTAYESGVRVVSQWDAVRLLWTSKPEEVTK